MPDYREITITIVDGEEMAHVWTNIPKYTNRLRKLGAKVLHDGASGVRLECPVAWFYPRKRRVGSKGGGNMEALQKARAQRRESTNESPKEG